MCEDVTKGSRLASPNSSINHQIKHPLSLVKMVSLVLHPFFGSVNTNDKHTYPVCVCLDVRHTTFTISYSNKVTVTRM